MHNSDVNLSVIVACFNAGETLAEQLNALISQKWHHGWEVIVVDNRSTDNSRQIVESFKNRFMNLRIVNASEKIGAAYARNVGIKCALSDRFAFCDADDKVADGWVAAIGDELEKYNVVVSKIDDQNLNEQWVREIWKVQYTEPEPILGFLPGAACYGLGITRRVYERVGEFDESLLRMSDIDYTWRIQLAGFDLRFLPHAVVHYRHRAKLKDMFIQAYKDGQAQVQLYKKYRDHGMPWKNLWNSIKSWISMARNIPVLKEKVDKAKWLIDLGFMTGRLRGSIRYRIAAL